MLQPMTATSSMAESLSAPNSPLLGGYRSSELSPPAAAPLAPPLGRPLAPRSRGTQGRGVYKALVDLIATSSRAGFWHDGGDGMPISLPISASPRIHGFVHSPKAARVITEPLVQAAVRAIGRQLDELTTHTFSDLPPTATRRAPTIGAAFGFSSSARNSPRTAPLSRSVDSSRPASASMADATARSISPEMPTSALSPRASPHTSPSSRRPPSSRTLPRDSMYDPTSHSGADGHEGGRPGSRSPSPNQHLREVEILSSGMGTLVALRAVVPTNHVAGLVRPLVRLLEHAHARLQAGAANALGHFASDDVLCGEIVRSTGCLDRLECLAASPGTSALDTTVRSAATATLMALTRIMTPNSKRAIFSSSKPRSTSPGGTPSGMRMPMAIRQMRANKPRRIGGSLLAVGAPRTPASSRLAARVDRDCSPRPMRPLANGPSPPATAPASACDDLMSDA